jgi:hypothetical protein
VPNVLDRLDSLVSQHLDKSFTVAALKNIMERRGLSGWSGKKKGDLVRMLVDRNTAALRPPLPTPAQWEFLVELLRETAQNIQPQFVYDAFSCRYAIKCIIMRETPDPLVASCAGPEQRVRTPSYPSEPCWPKCQHCRHPVIAKGLYPCFSCRDMMCASCIRYIDWAQICTGCWDDLTSSTV